MLNVVIAGTGYVGLTTGVCLAYIGHRVTCIDIDPVVVERLSRGMSTVHEPGLAEMLSQVRDNIRFSLYEQDCFRAADVVIIAVGTPSKSNGDADVSAVENVAGQIGMLLEPGSRSVIVNKSTVPIGSARRVRTVIESQLLKRGIHTKLSVVSNPEFLREGAAIQDMLYPDRIVVGADDIHAVNVMRELYTPILEQCFNRPASLEALADYPQPALLVTSPGSAELIKYASNAYLAMKISFINEFAGLAEKIGADIKEVARGIGMDKRIGMRYLESGLGWGGSCFGKDTRAIIYTAQQYGQPMELLAASVKVNYRQRLVVIDKLQELVKVIRGSTIGILGLSFKPYTDDLRDAPSVDIIRRLLELGAYVRVYDPIALDAFRREYPDIDVECGHNLLDTCRGCDAIVLVTEWPEFATINYRQVGSVMARRVLVDGRNLCDRRQVEDAGFQYRGVGR